MKCLTARSSLSSLQLAEKITSIKLGDVHAAMSLPAQYERGGGLMGREGGRRLKSV